MQAMESEKEVWDPAGIQLVGTFFSPLQSLHQVVNNCKLLRLYHILIHISYTVITVWFIVRSERTMVGGALFQGA